MVTWNVLVLETDLAICRFLGVTSEQAHLITSGMMYGVKARLLRDLVYRSTDSNRKAILETLNLITSTRREGIVQLHMFEATTPIS